MHGRIARAFAHQVVGDRVEDVHRARVVGWPRARPPPVGATGLEIGAVRGQMQGQCVSRQPGPVPSAGDDRREVCIGPGACQDLADRGHPGSTSRTPGFVTARTPSPDRWSPGVRAPRPPRVRTSSTLLRSTVWARRPVRIVGGLDMGTGFGGRPPGRDDRRASPAMNVSAPA